MKGREIKGIILVCLGGKGKRIKEDKVFPFKFFQL